MDRKIFNVPIRSNTTELFHQNKMSLEEFSQFVSSSIKGYKDNIEHLHGANMEEMFIETWFESFMAWCEVEPE